MNCFVYASRRAAAPVGLAKHGQQVCRCVIWFSEFDGVILVHPLLDAQKKQG